MNKDKYKVIHSALRLGVSAVLVWGAPTIGFGQSNFQTTNRFELDPSVGGMWVVPEPDNPIQVAFQKLESKDLEIQLDELRRLNRFSALVPDHDKTRIVAWIKQKLMEILPAGSSGETPSTRLFPQALLTALGKLGEADNAELAWTVAQKHSDLAMQVESLLIQWKSPLPLETWRSRIKTLEGDWQAISLAIQGVEALNDQSAASEIKELLLKPNLPLPIKIAGARVLGKLQTNGLESMAQSFLQSQFASKDLIAMQLLAEHSSDSSLVLQQEIVKSEQPAAANVAYQSISKYHPEKAGSLAPALVTHKEFNIRKQSIENLNKNPIESNLRLLGAVLRDPHIDLRDQAREFLFKHSSAPELRAIVNSIVDENIASDRVLAIEQALILAVQLDRKDLCTRFLTLLSHENEIIRIRAAWGLQEIATAEEVIVKVLAEVTRLTEQLKAGKGVSASERLQLTYLLHVFGSNYYEPAEPILREYVPELAQKMTPHARAAAIWSLGKILQGSQDAALSGQLQERFFDLGPPDAELENVRYACAITLGRLGAMEDPSALKSAGGTLPYKMGAAIEWVIENHGKLPKR